MAYPQKEKLRSLSELEHHYLEQISRSQSLPAAQVAQVCELLAVANNSTFAQAARLAGRKSGQVVAHLVRAFNLKGLTVLDLGHGGGSEVTYNQIKCECILSEFWRSPERKKDGTATWSLKTLQRVLRRVQDGLPEVSTYTIWWVLHRAGFSWQKNRSWCEAGVVIRVRKAGAVKVSDPDALAKQTLIERAYTLGDNWVYRSGLNGVLRNRYFRSTPKSLERLVSSGLSRPKFSATLAFASGVKQNRGGIFVDAWSETIC